MHLGVCMCAYVYVCVCMCMYVCLYVCMRVYVYLSLCICLYDYTRMPVLARTTHCMSYPCVHKFFSQYFFLRQKMFCEVGRMESTTKGTKRLLCNKETAVQQRDCCAGKWLLCQDETVVKKEIVVHERDSCVSFWGSWERDTRESRKKYSLFSLSLRVVATTRSPKTRLEMVIRMEIGNEKAQGLFSMKRCKWKDLQQHYWFWVSSRWPCRVLSSRERALPHSIVS